MKLRIQDNSGYLMTWNNIDGGGSEDFIEEWLVVDETGRDVFRSRTHEGALNYIIKEERAEKRKWMSDKRRELRANSRRVA